MKLGWQTFENSQHYVLPLSYVHTQRYGTTTGVHVYRYGLKRLGIVFQRLEEIWERPGRVKNKWKRSSKPINGLKMSGNSFGTRGSMLRASCELKGVLKWAGSRLLSAGLPSAGRCMWLGALQQVITRVLLLFSAHETQVRCTWLPSGKIQAKSEDISRLLCPEKRI